MTIQGWLIVAGVFSVSLVIALEVLMQRYYDQPMIDVESRHAPSATKTSGEDILGRLTLTDEERGAVNRAIATLDGWQRTGGYHSAVDDDAATLRSLLERLK